MNLIEAKKPELLALGFESHFGNSLTLRKEKENNFQYLLTAKPNTLHGFVQDTYKLEALVKHKGNTFKILPDCRVSYVDFLALVENLTAE